jgi:hypothetical protein
LNGKGRLHKVEEPYGGEGLAKFESALLNRGFYGGIAHIAFRDKAIQNLDDHVANQLKLSDAEAAHGFGRRAETDTGGDRGI